MNITLQRTTLLMVCVLLLGLSLLLVSACGNDSQENNKSESGGTASTNGQIAFRRYLLISAERSKAVNNGLYGEDVI